MCPQLSLLAWKYWGAGEWRHHNLKAGVIEHLSHTTEAEEGEGERAGDGWGGEDD